MRILGIETSCDETAAAVVEEGGVVLSNIIACSPQDASAFGGVVPELAARRQVECMIPVLEKALQMSGCREQDIDAIAVTKGPGLLTSLLVGTTTARMVASIWKKPLMGVPHTLGHLDSPWLECPQHIPFPVLTLSVSGGHTELWLRESHTRGLLLGQARDDAAGEAFDKGATLLGLPFPGGPAIATLAAKGDPHSTKFPPPLAGEKTCDCSFSGLKTALKYLIRDRGGVHALSEQERADIAASYQETICKHLISRVERALTMYPHSCEVHLVGGVSANQRLRALLTTLLSTFDHERREHRKIPLRTPKRLTYCTDNAAMIAAAGIFLLRERGKQAFENFETDAGRSLHMSH